MSARGRYPELHPQVGWHRADECFTAAAVPYARHLPLAWLQLWTQDERNRTDLFKPRRSLKWFVGYLVLGMGLPGALAIFLLLLKVCGFLENVWVCVHACLWVGGWVGGWVGVGVFFVSVRDCEWTPR